MNQLEIEFLEMYDADKILSQGLIADIVDEYFDSFLCANLYCIKIKNRKFYIEKAYGMYLQPIEVKP